MEEKTLRARKRREEQARKKIEAEEERKRWEAEQAIKREELRLKTVEFNKLLDQQKKAITDINAQILISLNKTEQLKSTKRGIQRAFGDKCICPYEYEMEETEGYRTYKYCTLCLHDKDKWGWSGK
jgi:hypothetical protein